MLDTHRQAVYIWHRDLRVVSKENVEDTKSESWTSFPIPFHKLSEQAVYSFTRNKPHSQLQSKTDDRATYSCIPSSSALHI